MSLVMLLNFRIFFKQKVPLLLIENLVTKMEFKAVDINTAVQKQTW
jgi:hypothetical protein